MKLAELIKKLNMLENTEDSEVKVVSFGGSYNIKAIDWDEYDECYKIYCYDDVDPCDACSV